MSEKIDSIIEDLKQLSLLEASQLVKKIEEVFQVDASVGGGVVMAAPLAAEGAAQNAEEEQKTEFDIVLDKVPADKKIAVLKIVRSVTGLGLKEAKQLVDTPPQTLKEAVAKDDAEKIKKDLEEVGAGISLK